MCFNMQIKLPFNFQESQFAVTGIKEHSVKSHSALAKTDFAAE